MKSFFHFVNVRLKTKKKITSISHDSVLITDDTYKANIFNKYFSSVFVEDNGCMEFLTQRKTEKFPFISFNHTVVEHFLGKIKPSFSLGPDGLCAFFMKKLKHVLCIPLSSIFEVSYRTSKIPSCWAKAFVLPILKKGNPLDINNYRPISLCCVSCKIMESIVNDKLSSYITLNKLLSDYQHGFSRGKSCLTQLLYCKNLWINSLNCKESVDVIFIDFAKAFDSVVHNKLILKLRKYGIDGFILKWLETFLQNRSQIVKINNSFSESLPVSSGVPQGSVLGPILFNIFINDIFECCCNYCEIFLFADDVKLFSSNSFELQNSLNLLSEWSKKWQLQVSIEKCSVLHLGSNNAETSYFLDGHELKRTNCVKDLGVFTSNTLSSTSQCHETYKKASRICSLIHKSFISRNKEIILQAYNVYVLPILDYCSSVYNPSKVSDIQLLEKVQRKFTKRLFHSKISYSDRLKHLCIETLEKRRLKHDLILAYKILHDKIPVLSSFLQYKHIIRPTRSSESMNLVVPKFKLDCKKYFFINRVSSILNSFPVTSMCMDRYNLKNFKRFLDATDLSRFLRGTNS